MNDALGEGIWSGDRVWKGSEDVCNGVDDDAAPGVAGVQVAAGVAGLSDGTNRRRLSSGVDRWLARGGGCGGEMRKSSGLNGRRAGVDRVGDARWKRLEPAADIRGLGGAVGVALVLAGFGNADDVNGSGNMIDGLFDSLWFSIGP